MAIVVGSSLAASSSAQKESASAYKQASALPQLPMSTCGSVEFERAADKHRLLYLAPAPITHAVPRLENRSFQTLQRRGYRYSEIFRAAGSLDNDATMERLIEVPEVEVKEVVKEIPIPVIKYIDRTIPKHVVNYYEKIIPVPVTLKQEEIVEVPEVVIVEVDVMKQVPQYQEIRKEITKFVVQGQERIVEVPGKLQEERPVWLPEVMVCDVIREVLKEKIEYVEKPMMKVEKIIAVEKIEEVPQVCKQEVIVEVPTARPIQVIKQVPEYIVQKVERRVPKPVTVCRQQDVEVGRNGVSLVNSPGGETEKQTPLRNEILSPLWPMALEASRPSSNQTLMGAELGPPQAVQDLDVAATLSKPRKVLVLPRPKPPAEPTLTAGDYPQTSRG
jgi:hypothetical protein